MLFCYGTVKAEKKSVPAAFGREPMKNLPPCRQEPYANAEQFRSGMRTQHRPCKKLPAVIKGLMQAELIFGFMRWRQVKKYRLRQQQRINSWLKEVGSFSNTEES